MVKIVLFILFILINIGLASIDAYKIEHNKRIKHAFNAFIYLILIAPIFNVTRDWKLTLGLLLIRIPVFNTSLNYFRGKELDYISTSTTSIIDKITNWIPNKIGYWVYSLILLLTSLILILL
jgi:hypothetical protein